MEVEHAAAAGAIHGLQQQPPSAASLARASSGEMLMVHNSDKTIKKPPQATPAS
uniref:Uncharacterized protein n=1 Tax=Oryza sativa subsp. japonica TaxID=39947 RepID=Q67WM4_ORYSJ|nr:hypothetical protein [Oryza sativa Japonica Group]